MINGPAIDNGSLSSFGGRRLPDFDGVLSDIVLTEIRATGDVERRARIEELVRGLEVKALDEEARGLGDHYVRRGIFPEKYRSDANQVALAVVHGIRYMASWNFRHLVKVRIRREVNLVNVLEGYEFIEIVAPPEL